MIAYVEFSGGKRSGRTRLMYAELLKSGTGLPTHDLCTFDRERGEYLCWSATTGEVYTYAYVRRDGALIKL